MSREEVFEELHRAWKHCLRCKLADQRLSRDEERKKHPNSVPLLAELPKECRLHVMYPVPDPVQYETGSVTGAYLSGEVGSISHGLFLYGIGLLSESLPWDEEHMAFTVAVGCRPVSFKDPRKVMKPNAEVLKACRPRWQTEVLLTDPTLVMACGQHAFRSIRPDLTTSFTSYIGEVVPFVIPTASGPVEYNAYVAPSPEDIHTTARVDQLTIEGWDWMPQQSHVQQPFHYWLWHQFYAIWLADTLRRFRDDLGIDQGSSLWPDIIAAFQRFYDTRSGVDALYSRVKSEIQLESGPGVRTIMKTLGIEDDSGEIDDDDEETGDEEAED